MDVAQLRQLLVAVQSGSADVEAALTALRDLPFSELGFATVDHHRALRQGAPEVIFGQGKTAEQIVGITRELAKNATNVLVTRLDASKAADVQKELPEIRYVPIARTATLESSPITPLGTSPVAVVSAGTGDMPVAEECAETLRILGISVERIYDVGVSGIHRLLQKRTVFDRTSVAVVVAGMEGALPSAVGGLIAIPIIAVPTSCGYGAALSGFAALASMLTSCASGITVCNIDNGFGAAFAAARIVRAKDRY